MEFLFRTHTASEEDIVCIEKQEFLKEKSTVGDNVLTLTLVPFTPRSKIKIKKIAIIDNEFAGINSEFIIFDMLCYFSSLHRVIVSGQIKLAQLLYKGINESKQDASNSSNIIKNITVCI